MESTKNLDVDGENDFNTREEEKHDVIESSSPIPEKARSRESTVYFQLSKHGGSEGQTLSGNMSYEEAEKIKKEETEQCNGKDDENYVEITQGEKIEEKTQQHNVKYVDITSEVYLGEKIKNSNGENKEEEEENDNVKEDGGEKDDCTEEIAESSDDEGSYWSDENEERSDSTDSEMRNAFSKDQKPLKDRIKDLLTPDGSLNVRTKKGYIVRVEGMYQSCMEKRPSGSAACMWDMGTFINLVRLRHDIKSNGYIPVRAQVLVDAEPKKPVQESLEEREGRVSKLEDIKIQFLKNEITVVDTIAEIKTKISKVDPKIDEGLASIEKFSSLEVQPLILKKNPFIVYTFMALSNYSGPKENCEENSNAMVGKVREKAKEILKKFEGMFNVPKNESFIAYFKDQVSFFWKMFSYDKKVICAITEDPMKQSYLR